VFSTMAMSAGFMVATLLSGQAVAQGIYTCVDGKGRKITADRQIVECADRIQQEVTPAGVVKRVLGPALTERELAAQEEKQKLQAARRLREREGKRRNQALILRYPNKASHDKERALALAQVDDLLGAALARTKELGAQRVIINSDSEFYKKDPNKAPAALVRRRDENDRSVAEQKRYMAEQTMEKQRVNTRFDEELVKLKQLWSMANPPLAFTPAGSPGDATKN
jgi:hypothetical protein